MKKISEVIMCQKCNDKGVIFIKCCNGQYCTCEGLPVNIQLCCTIDKSKNVSS